MLSSRNWPRMIRPGKRSRTAKLIEVPGLSSERPTFPISSGDCVRQGYSEFRHPGSSHVYFSAPGGQVFRLIDVDYEGP